MLKLMAEQMPGEDPRALRTRAREWAEENLIEAALMRQAALREPAAAETSTEAAVEALVSRITSQAAAPRHKEIVAYYLKHRDTFLAPETVRVAHIVKNIDENNSEESALEAIERARSEVAGGALFGKLADELSDCPGQGGELPWFGRGEMVPAFEDVVFQLQPNEISGVIRTEFGVHIAKLMERRAAGVRPLEDVAAHISNLLFIEKKQKRLHQYVDSLRARALIEREAK